MAKVKIMTVGDSIGVIFPNEVLARLNVKVGDELSLNFTPHGVELSPADSEHLRQQSVVPIAGIAQIPPPVTGNGLTTF